MANGYCFNAVIFKNTVILITEDILFAVFQYQVVDLGFLKGGFTSAKTCNLNSARGLKLKKVINHLQSPALLSSLSHTK